MIVFKIYMLENIESKWFNKDKQLNKIESIYELQKQ